MPAIAAAREECGVCKRRRVHLATACSARVRSIVTDRRHTPSCALQNATQAFDQTLISTVSMPSIGEALLTGGALGFLALAARGSRGDPGPAQPGRRVAHGPAAIAMQPGHTFLPDTPVHTPSKIERPGTGHGVVESIPAPILGAAPTRTTGTGTGSTYAKAGHRDARVGDRQGSRLAQAETGAYSARTVSPERHAMATMYAGRAGSGDAERYPAVARHGTDEGMSSGAAVDGDESPIRIEDLLGGV